MEGSKEKEGVGGVKNSWRCNRGEQKVNLQVGLLQGVTGAHWGVTELKGTTR